MADQPTLLVDEELVRRIVQESVSAAMKTALSDVPSRAEVERMIRDSAAKQAESYYDSFKSVDTHLRESERAFTSATGDFKEAVGQLRGVTKIIDGLKDEVNRLTERAEDHSDLIETVTNREAGLRKAIFGDPDLPGVVSVVQNMTERRVEANTQHTEIMKRIESIDSRLDQRVAPLERFVTSRQQFEARIVNLFRWFLNHPRVTVVLLSVIGVSVSIDTVKQLFETLVQLIQGLETP